MGPRPRRYAYDRRAAIDCSQTALHVERGDTYTVVAFFGERPEPFFPGPDLSLSSPPWAVAPGNFPMHSTWLFMYTLDADDHVPTNLEVAVPMTSSSFSGERCRP